MVWTEESVEKSTPEELVKMQLQEWAQTDTALAEALGARTPNNAQGCWEYIVEQAKKLPRNGVVGCVCVDNKTVCRWARDYYVDGIEMEAEAATLSAPPTRRSKKHAPRDLDDPKAQDPAPAPAPEPAPAPVAPPAPALQQLDLFAEGV